MDRHQYDAFVEVVRLSPVAPTVIWGAVMVAALLGAGATVWRGSGVASDERLIADAPADAALKRDVARLAAERNELAGRLASLERGVGELKFASRVQSAPQITGSTSRPPVEAAVEPKPIEPRPVEPRPVDTKPVDTKPVEAKPVEAKPVEPRPIPRAQAAPDITGAIARAFAAPMIDPKPGVFGVSLGRDASPDAIRRRWNTLAARYPGTLAKLAPRAQRNAEAAGLFDLVAGPFPNRADADRACATLAEQGLACDTTAYGGEPIGRP